VDAGHAHALVCDAVSLILLLSEIHDTTKSFVIALEDGKVVVSIVLISVLLYDDTIHWAFELQRLFDTVLHMISFIELSREILFRFDIGAIIIHIVVRIFTELHHLAISGVSLNDSPGLVLVDHMKCK